MLYSFKGGNDDGELPTGDLTAFKGVLYGNASEGGDHSLCKYFGCGVVFKVSIAGVEDVLYTFQGGSDGLEPVGQLTEHNGTFYGVTYLGGVDVVCHAYYYGCGTLFKVNTLGKESVLYRFKMGKSGFFPGAGLTNFNGKLYGTTESGGRLRCAVGSNPRGCGTVFALTP